MSQATTNMSAQSTSDGKARQPKALYLITVFELAERFSYFGMMAILLYYMYYPVGEGGLAFDLSLATAMIGAYSGLIYLSTVAGGWISDRVFGASRTLTLGAILVLLGHVSLVLIPGSTGLFIGLAAIALGSGATKATTASLVGSLYGPRDAQRIVGFTIFYLSLNVGALLGGLATAFLQQSFGFHVGFGAAAIGMVIALCVFLPTRSGLPESGRVTPNPARPVDIMRAVGITVALLAVLVGMFSTGIIELADSSLVVACIGVFAATVYVALIRNSKKVSTPEFGAVKRYLPIFGASVVQTTLWVQLYTAVGVHAEARSDRFIFGLDLPPSTAIAFGAIFAIVLTPVVNKIWTRLGSRQPGTASKYAISFTVLAAAFGVMAFWASDENAMIPVMIMLGVVGAFYLADLLAAPAGLSYATMSAPRAFGTQMVALHLLSYAIGSSLAGVVATAYTPDNAGRYFTAITIAAAVFAAILYFTRRWTSDDVHEEGTVSAN